jgi:hypothetical protein
MAAETVGSASVVIGVEERPLPRENAIDFSFKLSDDETAVAKGSVTDSSVSVAFALFSVSLSVSLCVLSLLSVLSVSPAFDRLASPSRDRRRRLAANGGGPGGRGGAIVCWKRMGRKK